MDEATAAHHPLEMETASRRQTERNDSGRRVRLGARRFSQRAQLTHRQSGTCMRLQIFTTRALFKLGAACLPSSWSDGKHDGKRDWRQMACRLVVGKHGGKQRTLALLHISCRMAILTYFVKN
jgi:hypothetical protein